MSTRALWSLLAAIGLLCLVGAAAAQDTASEPWLHVQISSDGHRDHGDGDGDDGDTDGRHDDGDDGRDDGPHDDDGDGRGHGRHDDDGDGRGHGRHDDDGDGRGHGRHDDHDGDDGDERADFEANINLPLSAVEPLLSLVPHGTLSDRLLDLAADEVNVGAMRDLWRAISGVGEAEFVAVDGEDETVRIARTGDQINVQVEECEEDGGETVDIRIPVAVVDALLSGDGEALNVHAAVEQLGELRGDIVRVSGGEHQVRVWIDEVAQPGGD